MGSGISAIYTLNSYLGAIAVSEKASNYVSKRDVRLDDYFDRILSRRTHEEATYSRNMSDMALHHEIDAKGLFGKPGKGKDVRIVESYDPMGTVMDFFEKISDGARVNTMNNDSALYCFLDDGVRINFRPYSSSPESPAVDIHIYSVDKIQKIHFVLRTL